MVTSKKKSPTKSKTKAPKGKAKTPKVNISTPTGKKRGRKLGSTNKKKTANTTPQVQPAQPVSVPQTSGPDGEGFVVEQATPAA